MSRRSRERRGARAHGGRSRAGYGVVATCVYEKRALKADERRTLVHQLSANLRRGLGETGTGFVLLRSFSALDLSIFAALENADRALDDAGYLSCSTPRSPTSATSRTSAASSRASAGSTPRPTPPTC